MMATLAPVHPLDEAPGVVASPDRIEAWLDMAKAGDRFIYASRCSLPVGSRGAALMRLAQERGLVRLHCPRNAENPTIFNYLAIRTDTQIKGAKPDRQTLSAHLAPADATMTAALLPVLQRAAHFGRPCPTDKQLAQRAGLTVPQVQFGMQSLVASGSIQVTAPSSQTKRRVTIVKTGQRTGSMA